MSDLGSLSHCMTDADAESMARARRLRRKSLLTSLGFEAAVVALLVVWPLFSPSVLGRRMEVLPLPPVRFTRPSNAESAPIGDRMPRPGINVTSLLTYHPHSAAHSAAPSGEDVPSTGDIGFDGFPSTDPLGGDSGNPPPVVPPPPAATRNKPPRISIGAMDGSLVRRVQPEYPIIARTIHLSGTVRIHAIIGIDGRVREVRVLSGSPILAKAAEAAVWQWIYEPTRLNGEPVEVETFVTVNFVLN